MKLKNVKTILCVFLAAIFALGLAACGGSGSESGEQTGQQLNEFTGVALNDGSFTYDGEEHSLSVSGTIPDGTQVAYENNGQTDAGEYTVTATLTCDGYRTAQLSATLTILKADYAGISFTGDSVLYDGEPHSLSVNGSLPAGTQVVYENNGQTEEGEYTVTATLRNPNYNDLILTATLRIYTVTDVAETILSSLFDRPDPWNFLPATFSKERLAYPAMPASGTEMFSSSVPVGSIGTKFIGKQLDVLYDGLGAAETALTAANAVFAAGETIVSVYQNFIDENPEDYDSFTGSVSLAGVPFSLRITLDGDTVTLLAGNSTVSVELVSDSSEDAVYTNSGRIQITDGIALKYDANETELKLAVQFTVGGIGVLQQIGFVRGDGAVSGYLYEFYGAESVALKTSALLYSDEDVTAVLSNKRESNDLAIDAYLEVYDSRTGAYIGGEVTETVSLVDYDTYWFALGSIDGIASIRVTEDDDENDNNSFQPHTVCLNGSAEPFAYKTVGGLSLRKPSRRFDIEMKEVSYIVAVADGETTSYEKREALIPMLFVQTDQTDTFTADVAEENSSLNLSLNSTAVQTTSTLFSALSENYETVKESMTYADILNYIGESDPFFETVAA